MVQNPITITSWNFWESCSHISSITCSPSRYLLNSVHLWFKFIIWKNYNQISLYFTGLDVDGHPAISHWFRAKKPHAIPETQIHDPDLGLTSTKIRHTHIIIRLKKLIFPKPVCIYTNLSATNSFCYC